ncbi:hypothetical protein IDJ75_13300 [Mucilaginibacter rigui]|uniref:Addiction module protein n=1 Tax=Mucilaginibacter rigui TaxID=534635 RepID=A0ABR7X6P4_9SPHI|nr:hypothetical protein [Mucilaginibacter rigui]MBD1386256.1 hypothetical protein [Mucilaginibacter rigui]
MISINLSIEQLIEAVRSLNQSEKQMLKDVLNDGEMLLSKEQEDIILQRQKAYSTGNMEAYSLDELKVMLNYTED